MDDQIATDNRQALVGAVLAHVLRAIAVDDSAAQFETITGGAIGPDWVVLDQAKCAIGSRVTCTSSEARSGYGKGGNDRRTEKANLRLHRVSFPKCVDGARSPGTEVPPPSVRVTAASLGGVTVQVPFVRVDEIDGIFTPLSCCNAVSGKSPVHIGFRGAYLNSPVISDRTFCAKPADFNGLHFRVGSLNCAHE